MPGVSVVIPTFDRPEGLRRCVAAMLGQTHADLEVIVCDDGGSTPAAATLADIADDRLIVLRQDNAGPAAARNRGAAAATGDLLAFTDDDCAPRPDWLARFAAAWDDEPRRAVGGRTVNALPDNPFSEASQVVVDWLYDQLNADPADAAFFTSNNLAVGRQAFLEAGGFDESYPLAAGEDRAWCRTWRRGGGRLAYVTTAIIDHHHELSLRSFWRQHVNYGRGGRHFRHTAGPADRDGQIGQLGGYVSLLTRPLPRRPVVAGLLALAQVAGAWGAYHERQVARGAAG